MPGYGLRGPNEGTGLLMWAEVEERLARSHDYWLASCRPDGRPHLMPVWAVWLDGSLWFSSSNGSRKTRNLRATPTCSVSTDDARNPVVVEADAEPVADPAQLRRVLDAENDKYGTAYGLELLDPAANTCFRLAPRWAFALHQDDFTGSPTVFTF
jgi:PPOX class probable F420-dependent enzyme